MTRLPITSRESEMPNQMTIDDTLSATAQPRMTAESEVTLSTRITPRVKVVLEEAAHRRGVSLSEFLRDLVLQNAGEHASPRDVSVLLDPLPSGPFGTVLADPPWRFMNRTGKVSPEHRRLSRYDTLTAAEIAALPVSESAADRSHLYLWVPNALLVHGLHVMRAWGFSYKGNIVWHKVRKDGGSDGRGMGFYFRNVTELVLFGVRGSLRTLPPARSQVNLLATRKREHSRKPDELYRILEACSPGPRLELFARYPRTGWSSWGKEAAEDVVPRGRRYPGYGAEEDSRADVA
jgi:N6-adenosine-specific RNA methylase IME4